MTAAECTILSTTLVTAEMSRERFGEFSFVRDICCSEKKRSSQQQMNISTFVYYISLFFCLPFPLMLINIDAANIGQ